MRTIIDLPDQQLKGLQKIADAHRLSRAEIVRQAVAEYLQRNDERSTPDSVWDRAFGLWARNPKMPIEDGLAYQLRMRDEWSNHDEPVKIRHAAQKIAAYKVPAKKRPATKQSR